jgi:hypothetical protein
LNLSGFKSTRALFIEISVFAVDCGPWTVVCGLWSVDL